MEPFKGGLKVPTLDYRDRDFLKTFGAAMVPTFPPEYDTDAKLWMPNQSEVNPEFPNTGPQPFGCTNYTQCDLAADLLGKLFDPGGMEAVTGASAKGGYDIRDSLLVAKSLGLISGFYNVKAYAPLDYFDAIRLAAFSGLPEKRSVSVGTPWYQEWQQAISGARKGVDGWWTLDERSVSNPYMPMPASLDYKGLGWHNWKVMGWKTVNGIPYLKCKPWLGSKVGDGGVLYFSREVINAVMNLKYTVAFTATHAQPGKVYKVDMGLIDKFVSYLRTLIGLRY